MIYLFLISLEEIYRIKGVDEGDADIGIQQN